MLAAVVVLGCGEFKEGFKKGFDRQKKAAEAKAAAEKKAAEASKLPQQTKAKSDKLIADSIVEKAVRRKLKEPKATNKADLEFIYLNLNDPEFTDEGLKDVHKLQKLEILGLNGTQITDAGLMEKGYYRSSSALS